MEPSSRRISDRHLTASKGLYAFYFAAMGVYLVYNNIYYESIGLSGAQIGVLTALSPLVSLLLVPLWGLLGDRFARVRTLLLAAAAGSALAAWGLSATTAFAGLALFALLVAAFYNPILPLLDSATLGLLGGRREQYGRQRVWGSLGFILVSSIFGYVLQTHGLHWLFYGFMALMAGFLLVALALPARPSGPVSATAGRGVGRLVRQRAWLWYAVGMGFANIAVSAQMYFLGIYLTRLGAGAPLVGNALALGAISEMPFMVLSAHLIRRYGSRAVLVVSTLVYALRSLLYAVMPAPEWALAIGLMNGLTFALNMIAGIAFVDEMAPGDLKATALTLNTAIAALGQVIGSPLNGWLLDAVGGRALFGAAAGVFAVSALILWAGTRRAAAAVEQSPEPGGG